jgi:hypothetical protein
VNSTQGNDFFPSLVLRGVEYVAGYQSTSIRLNGKGLYGGKSWMHRDRQGLVVDAQGPYHLEAFSMDGKKLYTAGGLGGERHSGLFARPGFYLVKVITQSASYTQKVLVR